MDENKKNELSLTEQNVGVKGNRRKVQEEKRAIQLEKQQ